MNIQRLAHEPVDDEAMQRRVDLGHAVMMTLEVQPARRNDAFEIFERRPRHAVPGGRTIAADIAHDVFFVFRRRTVAGEW